MKRFFARIQLKLLFILLTFCLLLLSACNQQIRQQAIDGSLSTAPAVTRIVKHALGQTQVPLHPQRIVTLDPFSAEYVLALGVEPVGAPGRTLLELQLPWDAKEKIADISWRPTNLEKVAALKPDLIFGNLADHQDIYQLLSHIAPTIMLKSSYLNWKQAFALVAQTLGKTDTFEQIIAAYDTRLADFKAKMGNRLDKTQVSVVRVTLQRNDVFIKGSFSGTILKDAGLTRPNAQNFDAAGGRRKGGNEVAYSFSPELLSIADGDALFVIPEASTGNIDAEKALQQLQTQPLWSKLKVVKQGKAYVVGRYWVCCGAIAANRVIDDLFKYLIPLSIDEKLPSS
ncbi:MAG: iron-siderophore ABC transporter substrate-binding protein [Nostoc sp.]|uniref:iron-siderophore ABC transporter substrate-binding protein n=1 Tax=Nostoc sp. TaxID=1180 RepID=UPI002FF526E3